jgi:hypothetical protein
VNLFGWLSQKRWRAAGAIALFALAGVPLHFAVKETGDINLPPVGVRAPLLQGPTLFGAAYDSLNDLGRALIIVFLDPTARTSREQGSSIASWRARYADEKAHVVVVMIGGSLEQQRQFAADVELPPDSAVLDRGGLRRKPFGVTKSPTTIVLDGHAITRFARAGVVRSRDGVFQRAVADAMSDRERRTMGPPGMPPGAPFVMPPGMSPEMPPMDPPEPPPESAP